MANGTCVVCGDSLIYVREDGIECGFECCRCGIRYESAPVPAGLHLWERIERLEMKVQKLERKLRNYEPDLR